MSRYAIKFPFRVRIHGGEFDESARAIHREDGLKTIQAESGIVLESTIERKQMSTKTTFKRIALVTVAALGFGVMSVAPSNAVIAGFTSTLSAASTTVPMGTAAKVTQTVAGIFGANNDTVTTTVALTSWPAGATNASIASMLSPTATAVDTATANTATTSNGQVEQTTAGVIGPNGALPQLSSGRTTWSVTPAVTATAGSYVYAVTATPAGGTAIVSTWTVVVTAPVVQFVTNFIGAAANATVDATTLEASGTAATAAVAVLTSRQYQTADATTLIDNSQASSVTVTVTGAGALGTADNTAVRGPAVVTAAGSLATTPIYLFADGRTGTATITTTIGTFSSVKTFKFLGTMTTLSATASKKNVGVGETMTLTAAGADVNGNATATPTVTAVSSDATIATVTASGAVATVTGVKAGTATITLTSGTVTLAVPVTVLPVTAATLAWKFDKDAYDAGEKMTLTITASGVADGARAVFTANPVANFTLSSGSDTVLGSPVFAAGVATYTLYAPATPGTFKITGTVNFAGVDTEAAIKTAATTYVASVATISATITNPALTAAQEATDAANEATDAGNNAKDAADQAIEAADAATIAAQDAAAAAEAAGEMAVAAAEAAGEIATEALDAANAATDAALSAAEAADAATSAATEAKEAAEAATAAVAALSAEVTKLIAGLTAKITSLSNVVAKIAKKVKA